VAQQDEPFHLSFNASLEIDFQGSRVTFDGGLIVVRELDERLGLGDLIVQHLTDSRRGKKYTAPTGRPEPHEEKTGYLPHQSLTIPS
jgi:hypothetical protein